jgi:hypothetical protein
MSGTKVGEEHDPLLAKISFEQRAADIAREEAEEAAAREEAKKNSEFYMVFRGPGRGAPALRLLIQENHHAGALFMYLAEMMDRTNAVVASGKALSEVLAISEASVSRAIKHLVDKKYVARFKTGGSNLFVANPDFVWNAWATGKQTCLFNNTKVLISKGEQDKTMMKRFNLVFEKNGTLLEKPSGEGVPKRGRGRPKKQVDAVLTPAELEAAGQTRLCD